MHDKATAMFDLEGRVAIVTGGAQGVGRGIAENLALAGAAVVIADVDQAESVACERDIVAAGGVAKAIGCDMAVEDSINELVVNTIEAFGQLDIVVNNAAIYPMSPISEMSTELWDKVLGVNLRGVFFADARGNAPLKESGPQRAPDQHLVNRHLEKLCRYGPLRCEQRRHRGVHALVCAGTRRGRRDCECHRARCGKDPRFAHCSG